MVDIIPFQINHPLTGTWISDDPAGSTVEYTILAVPPATRFWERLSLSVREVLAYSSLMNNHEKFTILRQIFSRLDSMCIAVGIVFLALFEPAD